MSTVTLCADYVPENESKWHDSLGDRYDCGWYEGNSEHCGEFSAFQNPKFNRTANEACCVCGGGVHRTETATATTTSTTMCFDWQPAPQEAWSDGDGNSCRYYERELLVRGTCSESANDGMTAIQACCVCGGGVSRTDAVTSSSGTTSSTTRSPTTWSATTLSATSTRTPLLADGAAPGAEETSSAAVLQLALVLGLAAAGLLAA